MEISAKEFDEKVLQADRPVLVDFWGSWCLPCKQMEPILEKLRDSEPDILVFEVNVNRSPRLRSRYQISGVPTLILFRDGEECGRTVGAQSLEQLKTFVSKCLE
ncbi:MAG: thioredoxin [Armatimonadetes bacterium]|nr:thioredoxin [Armatimonadota bacterium]